MEKTFEVNIRPGSSILKTYKNQSYKIENAFAEFIDNSTQSFFANSETLNKIGQTSCNIDIEIYPEYIKIYDNAFGMEIEDFKRALKLDSPPEDTSGRSEKGMGLKTSATCLGSLWMVETTQYGSNRKFKAQIDVDQIAKDSPESIKATWEDCDENEHYTIIRIEMLNKRITPAKVQNLIKSLGDMYSLDIRNNYLSMTINKEPVNSIQHDLWINAETGSVYKTTFEREFIIDDQRYKFSGWIGIRAVGDTEYSGLSIIRKGRAIIRHYRPSKLVGKSNSFAYQRIVGEIYLQGNNWEPSYTKDDLMWEGELEEKFIQELNQAAGSIIRKSNELRVTADRPVTKENQRKIADNVSKSFKTVDSEKINNIVNTKDTIVDIPKEDNNITVSNDDEFEKIEVNMQDQIFTFNTKFLKNDYSEWITLTQNLNGVNEYDLQINYGLDYFKNYKMERNNLELMQKMVITICLSVIISKSSGNPQAYMILQIMNTIVKSAK